MFIPSNYILANELAEKGNIHVANFSMLHNNLSNLGLPDTLKYGNCVFVDKNSNFLPKYIKDLANNPEIEYTDMSNKWLTSYATTELGVSKNYILSSLAEYHPTEVTVAKKKFIEFDNSFINLLHQKCLNVLTEEDTMECYNDGDIEGYIKLKKDKYITWYNVF